MYEGNSSRKSTVIPNIWRLVSSILNSPNTSLPVYICLLHISENHYCFELEARSFWIQINPNQFIGNKMRFPITWRKHASPYTKCTQAGGFLTPMASTPPRTVKLSLVHYVPLYPHIWFKKIAIITHIRIARFCSGQYPACDAQWVVMRGAVQSWRDFAETEREPLVSTGFPVGLKVFAWPLFLKVCKSVQITLIHKLWSN